MTAPTTFAQHQDADRRLTILKGLESAVQYRANEFLLQRFCDAVGHTVSRDRLRADVAWLFEQGLIEQQVGDVLVATLTVRGLDVATGRALCPGIARPQPSL
jgi:hypothetical protein